MNKILITGSGGLVGSEAVRYFSPLAEEIIGLDNNSRGRWFGSQGSVSASIERNHTFSNYKHLSLDIRNMDNISHLMRYLVPDAIIHCAGQPSHEKSAEIPFEDFQINTVGTVNLLEAARKYASKCSFVFTSTNKVYGDRPNHLPMIEKDTRFELIQDGIAEDMPIDQSLHSPFGANKAAADLIVQEYGKYYRMNTVCFRCGCITGGNHQGVEQHGFLNYLCKTVASEKTYTIFGHKGKQVRDNIHAADLISAFHAYLISPRRAAVYNIGGGKENSCSVLEAIQIAKELTKKNPQIKYDVGRKGDHICYQTNYNLFQSHYPTWKIKYPLKKIFQEILKVA
jgi:CDP-paratose 2-epimerase